jgi:hypothetical protein
MPRRFRTLTLSVAVIAGACGDSVMDVRTSTAPTLEYRGPEPWVVTDDSLLHMHGFHASDLDGDLELFQFAIDPPTQDVFYERLSGYEAAPVPRVNPPDPGTYPWSAVVHDSTSKFSRVNGTIIVVQGTRPR